MSFGFSIGDFVALGTLTWKICDKCKSSATEFRDLSREVSSMHFVLKAIERSWATNDLAPDQRYEISNLAEGCREVLKDLERLLDKYQSLGSNWKNPMDRFRWAANKIAPLRNRLLHSCVYLSTFNAALTSSLHGDRVATSEATILQKLNEMQLEFQEGKRAAPAFSLVTLENINQEETWQSISAELENVGLETGSLLSSQDFICSWIDEVMLADVDDRVDEVPSTSHSSPRNSFSIRSGKPADNSSSVPVALALDVESMSLESTSDHRPESPNLHRSMDSSWRPVNQPNPTYVQTLLKKLLNLEYGEFDVLPMKRVYSQLDWRDRGYLSRIDIEHHFLQAMKGSSFSTTNEKLMGLIKASDTNRSGRIGRDGFVRICQELVTLATEKYINDAILSGGREIRLEREWLIKRKNECPSSSSEFLTIDRGWQEHLNTATGLLSSSKPTLDPRTFGSMAFTAARVIVPRLSSSLECLSFKKAQPDVNRSCDLVREAALQFTILEGEFGSTKTSDLDLIMAIAHWVRRALWVRRAGGNAYGFLNIDLVLIQQAYFKLLEYLQGFASSLGCPTLEDRELFGPLNLLDVPTDKKWQRKYMSPFVRRIAAQSQECERFSEEIQRWRKWWDSPQSEKLKCSFDERRMALRYVRKCQLDETNPENRRVKIHSMLVTPEQLLSVPKRRYFDAHAEAAVHGRFSACQCTDAYRHFEFRWTTEKFEDFLVNSNSSLSFKLINNYDRSVMAKQTWDLRGLWEPFYGTSAVRRLESKIENKMGIFQMNVEMEFRSTETRRSKAARSDPDESRFVQSCPCPVGWKLKHTEDGDCYFHRSATRLRSERITVNFPASEKTDRNGLRLPDGWTRRRTEDGATVYHLAGKPETAQFSTPLYQGDFEKEAAPKSSDIQLLERDFERENAVTEWDTDVDGSKLGGAWIRRQEKDSGKMYYANLNTGQVGDRSIRWMKWGRFSGQASSGSNSQGSWRLDGQPED